MLEYFFRHQQGRTSGMLFRFVPRLLPPDTFWSRHQIPEQSQQKDFDKVYLGISIVPRSDWRGGEVDVHFFNLISRCVLSGGY